MILKIKDASVFSWTVDVRVRDHVISVVIHCMEVAMQSEF